MPCFFSSLNIKLFLAYVGSFVLLLWFLKLLYFLFIKCYAYLCQLYDFNVNWSSLPKWAVITGGSDGIGKAYAKELASKGFNIMLMSRSKEKLEYTASEIEKEFGVKTKIFCINFTDGPEIYKKIEPELENLEIGVLVNNMGMSYEYPEFFHLIENGLEVMNNLIQSNVVSCTMMIKLVLPGMVSRRKGVIINISSLIAVYPMPMLTMYSATKTYVDYLSRALHVEYKDKGIIIQSVLPGYVATNMSKRRHSLEVPTPERFVQSAIKTVGLETSTYGYFSHKIRGFVHEWLRDNMPQKVNMAIEMYYMKKGKNRYLKKIYANKSH